MTKRLEELSRQLRREQKKKPSKRNELPILKAILRELQEDNKKSKRSCS